MSDVVNESNGEMAFMGEANGFCWMPLAGESGAIAMSIISSIV